jgi:pSer/pThr/pTyr-binding forkhead associated (FHA) protein
MLRVPPLTWAQLTPYRVVPKGSSAARPTWRIALAFGLSNVIGLELRNDIVLGRGDAADLDLSPYQAEEKGVSRRHALLGLRATSLTLTDLGSTNGTWVNSLCLKLGQPHELSDNDSVRLGFLFFSVAIVQRPARVQ